MRRALVIACSPLALAGATIVACAGAENEDLGAPPLDAASVLDSTDSGPFQADRNDKNDVEGPLCSPAGWCVTALPDANLEVKHIWMLPGRAFALAERNGVGVKVLEWDDAEAKWAYIDDGTQNDSGVSTIRAGRIWAPSDNEVYYITSSNYIHHGTRPAAPPKTWSWTQRRLGDATNATNTNTRALGVWGTGSNDIYAWSDAAIYHWTSIDGGAPDWYAEYVAADLDTPEQSLAIFGAAGSAPDDVWFSGGRTATGPGGCAVLVHRTSEVYRRIADGVVDGEGCTERAGALLLGGTNGALTDLQMLATNQLIGLKGDRDVVKVSVEGGHYSVAVAPTPQTLFSQDAPAKLNSLSAVGETLWLAGVGLVIQGSNVWDGGAFRISTISLNGGPLQRPIYQVQGTSNTNLWAIGSSYALHKTTP